MKNNYLKNTIAYFDKWTPKELKKLLPLSLFVTSTLWGLQIYDDKIDNKNIFGICFEKNKQEFYADVRSIRSISIQEYMTSIYKVTELNLDTGNSSQLRIYATELIPQTMLSEIQDSTERFTQLPIQMKPPNPLEPIEKKVLDAVPSPIVFKEYPITTHAKTIEYQLATSNQVQELYIALRYNWGGEKPELDDESDKQNSTDANNEDNQLDPNRSKVKNIRTLRGKLFSVH